MTEQDKNNYNNVNQKNNTVSRDLVGGNVIYNIITNKGLIDELNRLTDIVKNKLPKGMYNHYLRQFVPFCAKHLFESLIELSIPTEVVLDIVNEVPNKINPELEEDPFSTRHLRKIVFNILQRLDYTKYSEKIIEIWGENYIRKYGYSDVELQVIYDNEQFYEKLDRSFIENKLLPDVYFKCYNSDLNIDLGLIKSKSLIKEISNEIFEKVRLLNIVHIRYSTLHKLAYDLAIQPPHHWFTDSAFKNKHIEYNISKLNIGYENYSNKIDIEYSLQECIEHSCATILSIYSLFIGIGKYRPLFSLTHYLLLRENNDIFWSTSDLSNIVADLKYINIENVNFNKFKHLLDKLQFEVKDINNYYFKILERIKILRNVTII